MTYISEPTAHTEQAKVISIRTDGSPRWLQIVRDAAVIAASLAIVAAVVFAFVLYQRASSAVSDFGEQFGEPSPTAACTDPNVPWCEPVGD
jgi:hypothetical protein